MKQIILKPLYHRGQERIGIYYKNDTSLNLIVRKLPNAKWSQPLKCFKVTAGFAKCGFTLTAAIQAYRNFVHLSMANKMEAC